MVTDMDIEKVKKTSKKAFEEGSQRDAALFLRMCIKAAFTDHNFRGIEMTKLDAPNRSVEGKSWHHTFGVRRVVVDGTKLWEVTVARTSLSDPLSHTVLLTKDSLEYYSK